MTLNDLLQDIYLLENEMRNFERKYGVLSETFYQSYINGEEPSDDSWVRDWAAWGSAYKLWLKRRKKYQMTEQKLRDETQTIIAIIEKTAKHEPIQILA